MSGSGMKTYSMVDSPSEDHSKKLQADTYSSTGSATSELVIPILFLENRTIDLDREIHQDPDGDRYIFRQRYKRFRQRSS